MDILKIAKENESLIIKHRRNIHINPELSSVEFETLEYIKKTLTLLNIDYIEVENGGIVGYIGDSQIGKTVLLRADIDALPILENQKNLVCERKVISQNIGVQHACGHDAHTAILLVAGKILKENEYKINGRVLLVFERGEEGGGNYRELLKYIEHQKLQVDAAHAIHVRPDVEAGKIVAKKGAVMAGGSGFTVKIIGSGGHGSRPDLSNNPLDCFVAIYEALKNIRLKYITPFEAFTFSICQVESGNKGNVIPNDLTFRGSARFLNPEVCDKYINEFKNILENITKAYHCTYETQGLFIGMSLQNNNKITEIAQNSIKKHLGEVHLISEFDPLMGSESFSRFARLFPSIMIHLGIKNELVGSGADLHNEFFDVDEGVLYLGVAETVGFAYDFLNYEGEIDFIPYKGTISDFLNSH